MLTTKRVTGAAWQWLVLLAVIFAVVAVTESAQPALEFCDVPKNHPSAQDIYYAAVFDVGSTGTRVHIFGYEAPKGEDDRLTLLMPGWTKKVKPGFATLYSLQCKLGDHQACTMYLDQLKLFMKETLSDEDLERTILMIRATGGFRILSHDDQETGLDILYEGLQEWGVSLGISGWISRDDVKVLNGAEEGAYSWLALNQLARRFRQDNLEHVKIHPLFKAVCGSTFSSEDQPLPFSSIKDNWKYEIEGQSQGSFAKDRVGMVEVGGASAQVVVEHTASHDLEQRDLPLGNFLIQLEGRDRYLLGYAGRRFQLAITPLEGFGRQAAFDSYLKFIAPQGLSSGEAFNVPCLPEGVRLPLKHEWLNSTSDTVVTEDRFTDQNATSSGLVFAVGQGDNNAYTCLQSIRTFLEYSLRSEAGRIEPLDLPPKYRIYATENLYYFNAYVAKANSTLFSTGQFWETAQKLCELADVEERRAEMHGDVSNEKVWSGCFGLVYMSELIKRVIKVGDQQLMKAVTSVKSLETSFAVGVALMEASRIHHRRFTPAHDAHHDEL